MIAHTGVGIIFKHHAESLGPMFKAPFTKRIAERYKTSYFDVHCE